MSHTLSKNEWAITIEGERGGGGRVPKDIKKL